jgi:hypothetical protein
MGAWLYTMLVKHFGAVAAVAVTTARWGCTSRMQLIHSLEAPDFNP